jgi:hypothetical protein
MIEKSSNNKAEKAVSDFYNEVGWETAADITEDARRWEDLRACAKSYVSKCRSRLLRHIPRAGEYFLDMASGPIQYDEYIEYSRGYKKRFCIDLSEGALRAAESKIGAHGVFLHGSFFDLNLEKSFFDCSISLHTIYHIDKEKQEEAVRKLISVTKTGRPIIIVYSNPNALMRRIATSIPMRALRILKVKLHQLKSSTSARQGSNPYFYAHRLDWWDRFTDIADVRIYPWRFLASGDQKRLIPNNRLGRWILDLLYRLEERFPSFFTKYGQYPIIVLVPKTITSRN